MEENRDILTLEQVEQMAREIADILVERFENNNPSARERLFSQSFLIFLKHFNILPPQSPQSKPTYSAFLRHWGVS